MGALAIAFALAIEFVAGRVVDPVGAPVAQATIVLVPAAAPASPTSMRSAEGGHFAFSFARGPLRIEIAAPGFRTRSFDVEGSREELGDIILTRGRSELTRAMRHSTLPADVLRSLRQQFARYRMISGADDEPIENSLRWTRLALGSSDGDALIVEGLGHLGGANNGPRPAYLRNGQRWTLALEAFGQRLVPLTRRTNGFADLLLAQHGSARLSIEIIYRFNRQRYQPAECREVFHPEWQDKPEVRPCPGDWVANWTATR